MHVIISWYLNSSRARIRSIFSVWLAISFDFCYVRIAYVARVQWGSNSPGLWFDYRCVCAFGVFSTGNSRRSAPPLRLHLTESLYFISIKNKQQRNAIWFWYFLSIIFAYFDGNGRWTECDKVAKRNESRSNGASKKNKKNWHSIEYEISRIFTNRTHSTQVSLVRVLMMKVVQVPSNVSSNTRANLYITAAHLNRSHTKLLLYWLNESEKIHNQRYEFAIGNELRDDETHAVLLRRNGP